MNLNEFKSGNIVYPKDHQDSVVEDPIVVYEDRPELFSFYFYNTGTMSGELIELNRISGIPLSIFWIRIFGFKNNIANSWYKDGIRVDFNDNGEFNGVFLVGETTPLFENNFSVSDLQNLYFERNRESLI